MSQQRLPIEPIKEVVIASGRGFEARKYHYRNPRDLDYTLCGWKVRKGNFLQGTGVEATCKHCRKRYNKMRQRWLRSRLQVVK